VVLVEEWKAIGKIKGKCSMATIPFPSLWSAALSGGFDWQGENCGWQPHDVAGFHSGAYYKRVPSSALTFRSSANQNESDMC